MTATHRHVLLGQIRDDGLRPVEFSIATQHYHEGVISTAGGERYFQISLDEDYNAQVSRILQAFAVRMQAYADGYLEYIIYDVERGWYRDKPKEPPRPGMPLVRIADGT